MKVMMASFKGLLALMTLASAEEMRQLNALSKFLSNIKHTHVSQDHDVEYKSSIKAERSNPDGDAGFHLPDFSGMMLSDEDKKKAKVYSEESTAVTQGFLEAFLGGQKLSSGELDCLMDGCGDLSGNIMSASENAMSITKQFLNVKTGDSPDEDHEEFYATPVEKRMAELKEENERLQKLKRKRESKDDDDLSIFYGSGRRLFNAEGMALEGGALMMQMVYSMKQITRLMHDLTSKCLKPDAIAVLKLAVQHAESPGYLMNEFMRNGATIMASLSAAQKAWSCKKYKSFGEEAGTVMKDILLDTSKDKINYKMPNDDELGILTTNFVNGFFGQGTSLRIKCKDHETINVDLHKCVKKNNRFFRSCWAAPMAFYEAEFKKHNSSDKEAIKEERKEEMQGLTGLAFAAMQIPRALRECNIDKAQEEALVDAIQAMGSGAHMQFHEPKLDVSKAQVAQLMAESLEAYTTGKWQNLGTDIGRLFQDAVCKVYSEKWALDEDGNLKSQLQEASAEFLEKRMGQGTLLTVLVAMAMTMFGLLVLKWRHVLEIRGLFGQGKDELLPESDFDTAVAE